MFDLKDLCEKSAAAKYEAGLLTTEKKNEVLICAAKMLKQESAYLLAENEKDLANAKENSISEGMQDRLRLTKERIEAMSEGLVQVASLPDPIGELLEEFERPNGLKIKKIRVPMGVIGIIFESRPNVTADAFALTFKSGNCVILKGGKEAINSNKAIVKVLKKALEQNGVNSDVLALIESTDRETTAQFMKMKEYVDVLIPRGGAGLIRAVVENSNIPVIETGTGNCHVYIDKDADPKMAVDILFNAKTQRISVCNCAESLLVHKDIAKDILPAIKESLDKKNVELRGDDISIEILGDCVVPATEEDYGKEYLDYILSVKTVGSVDEAIAHINKYNTHHSECIVTENAETAEKFLNGVDAACVYVNASTRFTDGFEFGFGAEIGISTQKLHARGPMGLRELTSYKYKVYGNGQIRQ
ncbi:MAG: glutamate-5-semialdehyde dehydrogenase [Lachnospiraceae bacterium]|nr:glutamate-5-semialdehyde dehydrogenase [Lachnospiraceae bacterium]